MRTVVVASLVTVNVLTGACTARVPRLLVTEPAATEEIERLVQRGCHACLETAFQSAMSAGLEQRAFETALLLAARSKELGLPHGRWIDAARGLVPPAAGWAEYLDIVLSLPLDPFSGDREDLLAESARYRRPRATLARWRSALSGGPGSEVFRAYLDLSLACGPLMFPERDAVRDAVLGKYGHVPLLRYRVAICGVPSLLTELGPGFADAEFELGRAALARERADEDEALARLTTAADAFPASASIRYAIGTLHERREAWDQALSAYDATLAIVPAHRDALVGRMVALSQLHRHDEAIASGARLLELGGWFVAEAHYWRAWNRYQQDDMAAARVEVDLAKTASSDAATLVLSGLIAWRENRLPVADAELSEALQQDFGHCEAALYLGQIRASGRRWSESLAALAHAEQCYAARISTHRAALDELGETEEADSRKLAFHERSLAEAAEGRVAALDRAVRVRQAIQ